MPEANPYQNLLDCLRWQDPLAPTAPPPAIDPAGWQRMLEQARRQQVAPLLAWQFQQKELLRQQGLLQNGQPVPPQIAAELHSSSLRSAAANMLLTRQVGEILQTLNQAGIPAIVLKGLHLAELVYPELQLRPISDVDLLIQRTQMQAAQQALAGLGYQPQRHSGAGATANDHHHLPPLRKDGAHPIELHWTLAPPGGVTAPEPGGVWQRAVPVRLGEQHALVLCREDTLLHLAVHFQAHNFRLTLRHLYDFVALLQPGSPPIDWEAVQTRSREWRAEKSLFLCLHLAHELLSCPLPPGLLVALQPPDFTPQLAALAQERLLAPPPIAVHSDLAALLGRMPLERRLRALAHALFPPPAYMAARYRLPLRTPLPYLAYLLRPIDLLLRYSSQLWRLRQPDGETSQAARRENQLNDWWNAAPPALSRPPKGA